MGCYLFLTDLKSVFPNLEFCLHNSYLDHVLTIYFTELIIYEWPSQLLFCFWMMPMCIKKENLIFLHMCQS